MAVLARQMDHNVDDPDREHVRTDREKFFFGVRVNAEINFSAFADDLLPLGPCRTSSWASTVARACSRMK